METKKLKKLFICDIEPEDNIWEIDRNKIWGTEHKAKNGEMRYYTSVWCNREGYEIITDMYEPHGFFIFNKYIIMYGHEDIWIYDTETKQIVKKHDTR